MKRVFTFVGFSMAVTLIALNVFLAKKCIIVLIGLAVIFAASLVLSKYRQAKVVPVSVGAALFACLLFCFNYYSVLTPQLALDDKTANATFYVVSQGEEKDGKYKYVAKTTEIKRKSAPQNIKVNLTSNKPIKPYTLVSGNLKFYTLKGGAFQSYGNFADGIYVNASSKSYMDLNMDVKSINKYMLKMHSSISNVTSDYINDDAGAFSNAIITGDKSKLSYNTQKYFNNAGASHIMAVSGLHLTVIVGAFLFIVRKLKLKKQIGNLLAVFLTVSYMFLAGFSGSVTRAGIMMIVMLLGGVINKRADALNSLGIAVSMLCINPYSVTDIGTLYSVVAVLSMLTLYPRISKKLYVKPKDPLLLTPKEKFNKFILKSISISAVSVVVSLCSLPISYLFFNRISIVSPISNILVIPLGSICVVLSMMTYSVSLITQGKLLLFVAGITKLFDSAVIDICKFFASFKASVITFDYRFGLIIGLTLILISIGFFFNKIGVKRAFLFSMCFLVLASSFMAYNARNDSRVYITSNGCIVANYKNNTVVYGVTSLNDLYDVEYIMNVLNDDVDVLVVGDKPYYSSSLSSQESVNILIANEFNDIILADSYFKHLEVHDEYNLQLCDELTLYYNQGKITIDINGFVVSNANSKADLFVAGQKAYDSKGKIDLKQGKILYTIGDNKSFKVRRINQWQK